MFKQRFRGFSNCRQAGGSIYGAQLVMIPSETEFCLDSDLAGWATLDLDLIPDTGTVYCLAVKTELGTMQHFS